MRNYGYLQFRMSADEHARIKELAQAKGYSISELARKALRMGLRFAEDFEVKPTDHAVRVRRMPGARQGPGVLTGPATTTPAA